jgi:Fic family protein
MSWAEIERLTALVKQLPLAERLPRQQLNQVLVSAHSTMIEGSRVTIQPALDFLTGDQARVGERLPWDSYDMLADHARALELVLHRANTRQLPTVALVQEIAGAVMRTTGKRTTSILGTTDAAKGDFRKDKVSILGATSFPNAQKVGPLVEALLRELRTQLPLARTLPEQLTLSFDAHQQLVSIHPFNDGNGRTARLLMSFVQHYYSQPLTVVFREDKRAYFEALEQSRRDDDLTLFREFMQGQHHKSLLQQLA